MRANPGSLIQLDQCQGCGGIWCDRWELFPVEPEEAVRLEALDEKLFTSPCPTVAKPLYCPRCTAELHTLKEPLLPREIILQRCLRCDGIWLNRGQLTQYKQYQQSTRSKNMPAEAVTEKLPEAFQNPKAWVVTGSGGMFAYPQGLASADEAVAATARGAFKFILRTLVSMLLGV